MTQTGGQDGGCHAARPCTDAGGTSTGPVHLSAEHYRAASRERIAAARNEYEAERYADCIYLSGLAVESMLRAYRCRKNSEFDSRHDLADLLKSSGLEGFVPKKRRQQVAALLGEVWSRWKNNYRFASNDRLATAFRDLGLFHGLSGNPLKANALTILESGFELVGIGDSRWQLTPVNE